MLNPNNELYQWGPISAYPLLMYFTIGHSFKEVKSDFGECYPFSLIPFVDNKVTWMMDLKTVSEHGKKFVQQNFLGDNDKYFSEWEKRSKELSTQFDKLTKVDIPSLSDEKLVSAYTQFKDIYFNWWSCTINIELAGIVLEPQLSKELKKHYSDSDETKFNQDFATLTSPDKLTFYRQEQADLIHILQLPVKEQIFVLKKHQQQYYWMFNSYAEAKVINIDYFQNELAKLTANKEEALAILKEIESYTTDTKQAKEQILSNINDEQVEHLSDLVSKFALLQDERKELNFKADHFVEEFAKEFSKRSNIAVNDIKYLLPDELHSVLSGFDEEIIKQRQQGLVFKCTDEKIEEIKGQKALDIYQQFKKPQKTYHSMIHGTLASSGDIHYFRGIAKVVLSIDEMDKLNEGDVLITTMTSPDFVIGMKKAGAIITDVGGLLSHAAIVARELKKPCIVGTTIATKAIKDGDIVELHCWRGYVRVVRG